MAMPVIGDDNTEWIQLGCYFRKVEEWEEDFWNNNDEFPNDWSKQSKFRLLAYETCKKWLELERNN